MSMRQYLGGGFIIESAFMALTQEERDFAEKNHGLVYKFLGVRKLDADAYYDIVIFGYLRAARRYCREEKLRRYAFSTIAWRSMDSEKRNHEDACARRRRWGTEVSLNAGMTEGGENLLNVIGDSQRQERVWEYIGAVIDRLTPEEVRQLNHIYFGYTIKESARISGVSLDTANRRQKNIKEAATKVMGPARG